MYGDPAINCREYFWEQLTRIGIYRSNPWFIIEDFNELMGNHEKRGGVLRHPSSFISFNLMIRYCVMSEFPCLGDKMSWREREKKQETDSVSARSGIS